MPADYEFDLPPELIAQRPPRRRGDARCLLVAPGRGVVGERVFRELPDLLRSGDRLVVNDSRVLPARLWTRRTDTGGRVEVLLLRPVDGPRVWACLARPARRLRPGQRLAVAGGGSRASELTVLSRADDGEVVVTADADLAAIAEHRGVMPLPPYIRRDGGGAADVEDRERYQTVYARPDGTGAGSVAAPTAGLHFSPATLSALEAAGVGISCVSLHVGPGTFQPPSAAQCAARRLHGEHFHLTERTAAEVTATRAAGGRVIAVGTTSLRVLETVARLELPETGGPNELDIGPSGTDPSPLFTGQARRREGRWDVSGVTRLFLTPPDRIQAADGLLTNFHLPGSSLLMLVATLVGGGWRDVYTHAVRERMRFYSYGDCMLVLPDHHAAARQEETRG